MEAIIMLGSLLRTLTRRRRVIDVAWAAAAVELVEWLVLECRDMLLGGLQAAAAHRSLPAPPLRAPLRVRDAEDAFNARPSATCPEPFARLGVEPPKGPVVVVKRLKRVVSRALGLKTVDLEGLQGLLGGLMAAASRQQEDHVIDIMEHRGRQRTVDAVSGLLDRLEGRLEAVLALGGEGVAVVVGRARERFRAAVLEAVQKGVTSRNRATLQWRTVLEEMANERGPWGAGEGAALFWTLDEAEDDIRRRFKLRRKEQSITHEAASAKMRGRQARRTAAEEEDEEEGGGMTHQPALQSWDQSLWANLAQYQRTSYAGLEVQEEVEKEEWELDSEDAGSEAGEEALGLGPEQPPKPPGGRSKSVSTSEGGGRDAGQAEEGVSRSCEVVQPFVLSPGVVEVWAGGLRFVASESLPSTPPPPSAAWALRPMASREWAAEELRMAHFRAYEQQPVALELFFADRTTLFLNLRTRAAAQAVHKAITALHARVLEGPAADPFPRVVLQRLRLLQGRGATRAWMHRHISNFEYLMLLNWAAGRTYNDLAQYPVFPWVLRDYASRQLDLRDPSTFRDLRFPMGAQRADARRRLVGMYDMLNQDYVRQAAEQEAWDAEAMGGPAPAPMPPFQHGTHYSTAGFVIWYLLRVEPFTSLHVQLQSGRFDHPDRQFRSVRAAFDSCVNNPSDVKELVPEFFYQPEFLRNNNRVDLGETQAGEVSEWSPST
jgi:hypothetical protein